MLEEIKLIYAHFHDAQIHKINFTDEFGKNEIQITLSVTSSQNNFSLDYVQLTFTEVNYFKFNYEKNHGILTVFSAFLYEENEIITIDFDCERVGEDCFKENQNSKFIVKCKNIAYKILSSE